MQRFWLKPGLRHAGDMRNLLVFARFARLKVSDARLQPRLPQALPRFAATQCAGLNTRSTRIIDTSYFYFGLVLDCIDADLCKYSPLDTHFSAFFEMYKINEIFFLHRSNFKF